MTTDSTATCRIGCQEPTFRHALEYDRSLCDGAVRFGKDVLGLTLDKWQEDVQRDWLAVDESGVYVHKRNGLEVPRQSGKTADVELRISYGSSVLGEKILYSAHDYSTISQLFDRMKEYYGERANDPEAKNKRLNKTVRSVRRATGKEAIFLKNGGAIYFSTRTKSSKRGFTVDVVVCDESQELTEVQSKAILSTASASPRGNPQYIFLGTPPGLESSGDTFASIRESVVNGKSVDDISWNEWSVDEVGDVSDVDRWYRVNPGLGVRITEDIVRAELGTYHDPVSFAQERLGYWLPKHKVATVIGPDEWEKCYTDDAPHGGAEDSPAPDGTIVVYGVKLSPDDSMGSISACIRPSEGTPFVALVEHFTLDNGIEPIARRLSSASSKIDGIAIDGKGTAKTLLDRTIALGASKRKVRMLTTNEASDAYASMRNAVRDGIVCHGGQHELDLSATKSAKRSIGKDGAFGFAATSEADSTPIESASIAHWSALRSAGKRRRKVACG